LSTIVDVLPMGNDTLEQALYVEGKDFEDTLQYLCAVQNHCDAIITRNEKDFRFSRGLRDLPEPIPVYSPDSFLWLI
jgi:hypothetical protein